MTSDVLHTTLRDVKVADLKLGMHVAYVGGFRRVATIEPPNVYGLVRVRYKGGQAALLHIGGTVHVLAFDEEYGVSYVVDAGMVA